jgi:hypothetical protein
MFTLEIDGKPIAVTDAGESQARELFQSQAFRDDLLEMESDGEALWDGKKPLNVRPASEDEIDAFDDTMDEDEEDEDDTNEDDEEGINVLFLVPVDDADEDDDSDAVS